MLTCIAVTATLGCATYSDRTVAAREAVDKGDYDEGIAQLNDFLGVKSAEEVPADIDGDRPLALLERGTLQQARGNFSSSARDLGVADQEIDYLDISSDVAGEIGKYIYSDSATLYRATPTEKLSLNGVNLLNYLAQDDLNGAAVEARRFTVMRNYLIDYDPESAHGAFGSYFAGLVFERLGEYDRALRYYDEALQERTLKTLKGPIERLLPRTQYRGESLKTFIEEEIPDGAESLSSAATAALAPAEIITILSVGRVPYKIPKREKVGALVGVAGVFITGDLEVLKYSALKVVVYPEMVPSTSLYRDAVVTIDGVPSLVEVVSDLGAEIQREYDDMKPQIVGAAISRMIARAAIAEGARAAGNQESAALGTIAALLAEGAMLAMDKPDTRSWTMLPGTILVSRETVPPGLHRIDVALQGGPELSRSFDVEVPAGGIATVVWTVPR